MMFHHAKQQITVMEIREFQYLYLFLSLLPVSTPEKKPQKSYAKERIKIKMISLFFS